MSLDTGVMTWVIAALLAIVLSGWIVLPLLRRKSADRSDRASFDLSVYRDQLAEIDRDVARGVLSVAEADAVRLEIKRRMLAVSGPAAAVVGEGTKAAKAPKRSRALGFTLVVLLPLISLGIYAELGSPRLPDLPLASRTDVQTAEREADANQAPQQMSPETLELSMAVDQLAARLADRPNDLRGWHMLGRSYLILGKPGEAVNALAHAHDIAKDDPDVAADYAEAMILANQGRLTPAAMHLLEQVVAVSPHDPRAVFYIGLGKAQAGDVSGALHDWVDLMATADPNAEWLPEVKRRAEQAAAQLGVNLADVKPSDGLTPSPAPGEAPAGGMLGPSASDVEAAQQMTPEAQQQMIRGMVDRLAVRLQANPDDRQGWLRLARAYEVLGETDKAADARARAAALPDR